MSDKRTRNNFLVRQARNRRQLLELQNREGEIDDLGQLTPNLGDINSGYTIYGDDVTIDPSTHPATFTGTGFVQGWPPIEVQTDVYAVWFALEAGVVTYYVSSIDGKVYAASGAVVIDQLGISRTGINFFDRWTATNAGITRRREIGSFLPTGSTTPAGYDWFGDPTENTNLQTNGDFELGNLNNFDAADSGAPSWAASSASPYAGTYAALLTTTDDADGSELQTNGDFETGDLTGWVLTGTGSGGAVGAPFNQAGTYSYRWSGTASQTGVLTTDLGTPDRMAVTAGLYYRLEASVLGAVSQWSTFSIAIKWYTATSAGSLISTDTQNITPSLTFTRYGYTLLAPATAAGAEIVITHNRNANVNTSSCTWDSISFKAAQYGTLTTNLGGTPRMAVTAGNSYQFSAYAKTDTSGSGVWKLVQAEINWYTATSGGSLVSTSTIPISLTTSYANTALPFIAPATAAGATIVITAVRDSTTSYDSTVLAYFDEISLRLLTVSRYIKWLPNVTIEGGPLDLALLSAAASTPASGIVSTYGLSADKNIYAINSAGNVNILTPFQDVATPSTSASVDFQNIPQTGHDLHITGFLLPATDDVALYLRLNNYSGASDYGWNVDGTDGGLDASDSEIQLITGTTAGSGVGNGSSEGVYFEIVIPAYTDVIGSIRRGIMATSTWHAASGGVGHATAGGVLFKSEAVTRATILFESGNIASGKVRYYLT